MFVSDISDTNLYLQATAPATQAISPVTRRSLPELILYPIRAHPPCSPLDSKLILSAPRRHPNSATILICSVAGLSDCFLATSPCIALYYCIVESWLHFPLPGASAAHSLSLIATALFLLVLPRPSLARMSTPTTTTSATTATATMADGTPRNITPPDSNNSSFNNNSFDNPLVNSAGWSSNSPQSHHFPALLPHPATRQIHPPKSPLYVPAVLRPTERPVSRRPLTPPRSMHSSTDSLTGAKPTARPHTPSQPIHIITSLTRSSTASSGPTTPTSWQPKRDHWKPDAHATHCDAPGCSLAFSLLTRRHHCRRCGGIFCSNHASQQVPLDEEAEISENGGLQRACDSCYADWAAYNQGIMNGEEGEQSGSSAKAGSGKGRMIMGKKKDENGDAAASVPKDWSWSTF